MLFLPLFIYAQPAKLLVEYSSYADSQVDTTQVFSVYDSLQVLMDFNDSADVDLVYQYSNDGNTWASTAKLSDIVLTAAGSAYYGMPYAKPHIYGRFILTFAGSANGTTSATYAVWIKEFVNGLRY